MFEYSNNSNFTICKFLQPESHILIYNYKIKYNIVRIVAIEMIRANRSDNSVPRIDLFNA